MIVWMQENGNSCRFKYKQNLDMIQGPIAICILDIVGEFSTRICMLDLQGNILVALTSMSSD